MPEATEDKQHSYTGRVFSQREILSTKQGNEILSTKQGVLKVRGAIRMHVGTLNYLGSQERLL